MTIVEHGRVDAFIGTGRVDGLSPSQGHVPPMHETGTTRGDDITAFTLPDAASQSTAIPAHGNLLPIDVVKAQSVELVRSANSPHGRVLSFFNRVFDALAARWQLRPEAFGGTAVAAVIEMPELIDEGQIREDEAVRQSLTTIGDFLRSADLMQPDVDFYLCKDPEEIGISRSALEDMEKIGYQSSGYGDRAEGKDLFEKAYRGYADEDRLGDLRFVIVAKDDEATGDKTPIAFFDYFRAGKHLFPECDAAAKEFRDANGLSEAGIYIVSKLVRDPRYAKEMRGIHRYALASTMAALANLNSDGNFIETQAQPATRLMISKAAKTYLPDLEILLDQEIETDGHGGPDGGKASKMLLYIPSHESRD